MKTSCLEYLPRGELKLFSLIAKSLLDSVCSSSESNSHLHLRCPHRRHCRPHCRCHCCCHPRRRCPLPLLSPLPSPSAIAVAIAVAHHRRRIRCIVVSHRRCPQPCRWPLPSLSPSTIAVAIPIGHCCRHCCRPLPRVVALAQKKLYLNNLSK
jgi:hypothetical protein